MQTSVSAATSTTGRVPTPAQSAGIAPVRCKGGELMPRIKWITPPSIARVILGAAAEQGRTEAEMAAAIGIATSTFHYQKQDISRRMSYTGIICLCQFLGISLEEFAATVPLKSDGLCK